MGFGELSEASQLLDLLLLPLSVVKHILAQVFRILFGPGLKDVASLQASARLLRHTLD